MSHDQHRSIRIADPRDAEIPPSLLSHEIGLSPQRFRELSAGEDAYVRTGGAGAHGRS